MLSTLPSNTDSYITTFTVVNRRAFRMIRKHVEATTEGLLLLVGQNDARHRAPLGLSQNYKFVKPINLLRFYQQH